MATAKTNPLPDSVDFSEEVARARAHLEDFVQTEKEHRAIVEALKKRDKKAAVQALREHLKRGEQEALQ